MRRGLRAAVCLFMLSVIGSLAEAQAPNLESYALRELDLIAIQVYDEPDLSKEQRIDGSGAVRMGLIGTVELAGLTLEEAEDKLEQLYVAERYLRDPQISIEVRQYAPLYVHVFGQVGRAGRVQLEGEDLRMPLLDVISAVGGFSGLAKSDAVRITRTDENGTETVVTVNAEALINGKAPNIPPEFLTLQPGDVVFVPERLF